MRVYGAFVSLIYRLLGASIVSFSNLSHSLVESSASPKRIHSNFHWTRGAHVATFGSTKLFTSVPSSTLSGRRRLLNREREEKEDMREWGRGKREGRETRRRLAKTKNGEKKTKRKTRWRKIAGSQRGRRRSTRGRIGKERVGEE